MYKFTGDLLRIYGILESLTTRLDGDERKLKKSTRIIDSIRIEVSTGFKKLEDLYDKK